jgi:hypothetical protein
MAAGGSENFISLEYTFPVYCVEIYMYWGERGGKRWIVDDETQG